ncbi:MAG: sugar phosphate isomerase/epimerase [Clostridiales bacterium]|nr:sugar phosphate isomerase/epimerase [Clostridiales bacterium]
MKLSVMTLSMLFMAEFKYSVDHDEEDYEEFYDEMMRTISNCGYRAADVCFETNVLSADKIRAILDRYGLSVSSYIYMGQFAAEKNSSEQIEKAKKAADLAVALGTEVLMLVPQAYEGIEACPAAEIQERLISNFTPVCSYAGEKGLHVVIEDTPDLRLHLCSAQDVEKVLCAVPGLELVYDSGNMILVGEDPAEYYHIFENCTAHIHLKDMKKLAEDEPVPRFSDISLNGERYVTAPTGTGVIDLKRVVRAVRDSGYDGYMTVEFQVDNDGDYRKSLVRCREYFENIGD